MSELQDALAQSNTADFEYEYVEPEEIKEPIQKQLEHPEPALISYESPAAAMEIEIDEVVMKRNLFKCAKNGNVREFIKLVEQIPPKKVFNRCNLPNNYHPLQIYLPLKLIQKAKA